MKTFPNPDTQFKPGESGNPNGRPKKITNIVKELLGDYLECELSPSQVKEFIMRCMEMNEPELQNIADSKTAPVFLVATAKALIKDMESGRTTTLENVFDRVMGRPKQALEHTGKDGGPIETQTIIFGDTEIGF